jgi:NAD(P)H-dependent FMN reductase
VHALRNELQRAHGIILGTPEYHSGVSGVLKNALDLMGFNEFEGKMLGLVGISGGKLGAIGALNSLRAIGRSLHAWVIPEQVAIAEAWKAFAEDGSITNEDYENRLMEVGFKVAQFACLHVSNEDNAFLRKWEKAPYNPGAADYTTE